MADFRRGQRFDPLGYAPDCHVVFVIGDVVPHISDGIEDDRCQQGRSRTGEAIGGAPDSPQLALTLSVFGSSCRAQCPLAGIEEFQREVKLIATAVPVCPGLGRGLALPPSNGIREIRTAPQFGLALLLAKSPVAQAPIHLRRFRLFGCPVGEAVPLANETFVAEIQ
jgi:hypothetical protein